MIKRNAEKFIKKVGCGFPGGVDYWATPER
jgi:hypothetical protein